MEKNQNNIDPTLWDSNTISIIIPYWNQPELTRQCIDALRSTKSQFHLEIITVNNGSTNVDRSIFGLDTSLSHLYLPTNLGFAGAVNKGLHHANGKYVVVIHNDVIVPENWLEPLITTLEANDDIGAVGPMTNWTTGPQWERSARYKGIKEFNEYYCNRREADEIDIVPFIRSFCMMFPLDLVYTTGGFDERFFPARFENEDFCKRITRQGKKCAVVRRSFVHHFGSSTLNDYPKSITTIIEENKKRFVQKWGILPETGEPLVPFMIKNSEASGREITSRSSPNILQELLQDGNTLVEKGDIAGAVRSYMRVLEQNPNFIEALHNLSILAIKKENYQDAFALTTRIHQLEPHFAPAYFIDGLIAQSRGNSETALQNFKKAIFYDVTFVQAYDVYRQVAESLGKKIRDRNADIVFYTAGMSFDGETIYKRGLGGSESALFYMARSLAQSGLTVNVFNNCERPGVYEKVEYGDLTDFYIFNYFNKAKVFISSRSFKPFQQNIHADKLVVWLHDTVDVAYLKGVDFSKINWDRLELFALSRWQARLWADYLRIPEEKFYITRNGYDQSRFDIVGVKRKRNKLIYSSRPCRGLDILLDVFPQIRNEVPDAELHVFAYSLSEKDNEIEQVKRKLNQPGVIFRGSISQKELAREMMEARVLVYPGIFEETSCITAIEAQAAGLPIVTSHLAALPETVIDKETGVLIKGDARTSEYQEIFVREVVDLLQNDSRWNEMRRNGRERALLLYQWDTIANEWKEHLFESANSQKQPKISLCMIVKNEASLLPEFFDNVQDIVDEIIVVDTGSSDETISICKKHGAHVYTFPWQDDFALARNESLKYATGEWILYLDPDECIRVEDKEKIKRLVDFPDITAINVTEHIPQKQGNLMRSVASSYCRLFRNHPNVRFEGRIHEQILPSIIKSGGNIYKSNIVIEHRHYGISEDKKKERAKRNLRILLSELKEHPADEFVLYNIGCTYRDSGNTDEAKNYFQQLLSLPAPNLKPELLSSAATYLGQIALKEGNHKEVLKMAKIGRSLAPANLLAWYLGITVAFEEGRYSDARDDLETILNLNSTYDAQSNFGFINLHQVYLDLGNCYFKMNDFHGAHQYYTKAIEVQRDSLELLFNDGICLMQLNQMKQAERVFRKLIEIYPDFEPAKKNLDWCLVKRN